MMGRLSGKIGFLSVHWLVLYVHRKTVSVGFSVLVEIVLDIQIKDFHQTGRDYTTHEAAPVVCSRFFLLFVVILCLFLVVV